MKTVAKKIKKKLPRKEIRVLDPSIELFNAIHYMAKINVRSVSSQAEFLLKNIPEVQSVMKKLADQ